MSFCDLTPSAEADLEEIARYTLRTWGERQAERYAAALDECFEKIAAGRAISRTFSAVFPQVEVTRCEHHYVFFVRSGNGKSCVIAILHDRMEIVARLKHRLS